MPSVTPSITYDTFERSVVNFFYGGGGGALTSYSLTGNVAASTLTGYDSGLTQAGMTTVNINVSKVFWSIGGTAAIELAWGVSGSITGDPFLYLNGSGYVNFAADGINFRNTSLTAATRINTIQFRNVGPMGSNDTMSLVIELDKNGGFIRRM